MIHSRLASGGRTAMGKFSARDSSAMLAMLSIDGRGVLHVHPREIQAGGLQQRQDRRIAHQVDPGADLQFAALERGTQWIGLHRYFLLIAAARAITVFARCTTGTSIIAPSNCTAPRPCANAAS